MIDYDKKLQPIATNVIKHLNGLLERCRSSQYFAENLKNSRPGRRDSVKTQLTKSWKSSSRNYRSGNARAQVPLHGIKGEALVAREAASEKRFSTR